MTYKPGDPIQIRTEDGTWLSVNGKYLRVGDVPGMHWIHMDTGLFQWLETDIRYDIDAHSDSKAVDVFAKAMKEKLYQARLRGRGGWDKPDECTVDLLAKMLMMETTEGDPVGVANFAMMLFMRKAKPEVLSHAARDFQERMAAPIREELEDIKELCIEAGCTDPGDEYTVSAMCMVEELRQRTVCTTPYHYIDDVSPESIEAFCKLCDDLGVVPNLSHETKKVWDALTRNPFADEDPKL